MKKKLTISVAELVHKKPTTDPQTAKSRDHPTLKPPPLSDKPMSFEDIYRQAKKAGTPKFIYDRKQSAPINTQRPKRGSINSILAGSATNKTAAPRMLNPKSGTTTSNQSMAQTPQNQSRKNSVSSINKENCSKFDPNIQQFIQEFKTAIAPSPPMQQPQEEPCHIFLSLFDKIVKDLDHSTHSHLRKDQCFLADSEILLLFQRLGYDASHVLYRQILGLLEVDVYGGVPALNLKKLISIIEGLDNNCDSPIISGKIELPQRIINNNLQLTPTLAQKQAIYHYFRSFRLTRGLPHSDKTPEKVPSPNAYVAPGKQSDSGLKMSPKFQPEEDCSLETFRKKPTSQCLSTSSLDEEEKLYSSSKKAQFPTSEQSEHSAADIITLKNRLNEALEKSSSIASELSQLAQKGKEISPKRATRYGSKPILSVDVNLGEGLSQKIIVYEGESAKMVSDRLASKFNISEETKSKFEKMLESHLSTMLWKIEELSEEMLTDRDLE